MPTTQRRIDPGLSQRLNNEPYRFDFFQAVRLLLIQHRKSSNAQDLDVLGQVIRFRNSVSLGFPPSEIESLEFEWENDATETGSDASVRGTFARFKSVTLTPSFIGLTGPLGVMPRHYTQHVAEREIYHRDHATRAFFDIFTSRAVALFYQAWLKSRLHLQYEADRQNRFLPLILGLAGLDMESEEDTPRSQLGISDEVLAYYAGPFRERPQSAQWFSRVVSDYFQVRCAVDQFVGQWIALPERELTRLGASNCALGETTFCGARTWDRQSKVRLVIGPLRQEQFDNFLPEGDAGKKLGYLFHLMVGVVFDCEVRLLLDKRDVRTAVLHSEVLGAQLGWNGWLASLPAVRDANDASYLLGSGKASESG
jgi:type VI secretion system protein ImpH